MLLRHRVFYLLILLAVLAGCQQGVSEQAGGNSWELYRTLAYYKYVDRDTAKYDGNMQTAPSPYPNITLRLKEPQTVTHVRFAPKNADNGIRAGDVYELYYWDDGWRSCGTSRAMHEYVEFGDVPQGKLYWLENQTQGEEEMPFMIGHSHEQIFFYPHINQF